MKKINCFSCNKKNLGKNTIGINKKLLGNDIKSFYCINCLADYLGTTSEELFEKIEEFKDDGCTLFE